MSARDERGSLAIEYVIVAPLFLLVFALIFAYARIGQLDGLLDSATRDAARAVTQYPNLDDVAGVDRLAQTTVADELGKGSGGCSSRNVKATVSATRAGVELPAGSALEPGDTVTVSARCSYTLADLGLPVYLPSMTATAQFSSVIDPNRSTG